MIKQRVTTQKRNKIFLCFSEDITASVCAKKDSNMMNCSYVMGIGKDIFDLAEQGFSIGKDGDNYTVSFPNDLTEVWENFIIKNLEVGYWNEYITEDKIVFIFRLSEGIKRYEVYDFQNDEVLELCERLCDCKFVSLKKMLCDNHFYSQLIQ